MKGEHVEKHHLQTNELETKLLEVEKQLATLTIANERYRQEMLRFEEALNEERDDYVTELKALSAHLSNHQQAIFDIIPWLMDDKYLERVTNERYRAALGVLAELDMQNRGLM